MLSQRLFILFTSSALLLSGCASGTFKARQEQREKLAASTGMYCEFVSGDLNPDLDVELSMQMARRCDANRSFSITNYKNSSDHNGVIYCCASTKRGAVTSKKTSTPAPKTEVEDPNAEVISE
ncbi:MAG: hypothetical protein OM95_05205 [Bdellovibrio sp. ArHS]|uniref:hypothetical protein n=1 Tax=Bdellovibrio sp. ArHS TaxID=1569284 RepID=UPI000583B3D1|nr:hypothetical protein [Bdellovibrio sp. ArHS]KHD89213.1 MAG: hypothetical protein OM95_05205 [Bdellovibrio sp. ArHS]